MGEPKSPVADTQRREFLRDVLAGMARNPKEIPPKYFYDAVGARLFEEICGLPEYYLTRTENALLRIHAAEMAACIGPDCVLVEYGSGGGHKVRTLLAALDRVRAYVPVDICGPQLRQTAADLTASFPSVPVTPVCADYTRLDRLPAKIARGRRVIFFPGSTIGNLHPPEVVALLGLSARVVGDGGAMLVGVDLQKPHEVLDAAYNDSAGVTAAFNRNLLARINRELGADFDPSSFAHRAFYDPEAGRVEMHLESVRRQTVSIAGHPYLLEEGERLHTENSYKYTADGFRALAARGGFALRRSWVDDAHGFGVFYLAASRG